MSLHYFLDLPQGGVTYLFTPLCCLGESCNSGRSLMIFWHIIQKNSLGWYHI